MKRPDKATLMRRIAQKTADKYISRDGLNRNSDGDPVTAAEIAWRAHAETVHRYLRCSSANTGRAAALSAFERIGEAIAETEKKAKR